MFDAIYYNSLAIAWAMLFIFAIVLFFGSVPQTDAYRSYNKTRKILSVALFLWGVQILLQWMFNLREMAPHIATALNITCFYMGGLLFGMGYISLLDPSYISRKQMRSDLSKWLLVGVAVWSAVLFLQGTTRYFVLIAAAAFFLGDATRISWIFFRTYRRTVYEIKNYYPEHIEAFIHWIYRSTFGIVFFGLIGAVMAFAPKWAVGLYMTAGIVMFVYIFIALLNYSINCEKVGVAVTETLTDAPSVERSPASDNDLGSKLDEWVAEGRYRNQGVTMGQLTESFGLNRNILSEYFNQMLHTSFRDWITDLRMTDAKHLLLENSNITIEEIAQHTGFSSKSYFSTVFKQREGVTPSVWRKRQERMKIVHHTPA